MIDNIYNYSFVQCAPVVAIANVILHCCFCNAGPRRRLVYEKNCFYASFVTLIILPDCKKALICIVTEVITITLLSTS